MTATLHTWVMGEIQKIRTGRHCTFVMHVHLVFVTKFRHKVFTDVHLTRMEEIMRSVCEDFECAPRAVCARNFPTWYATTGGRTSSGRVRTSPGLSVVPSSPSSGSTSSSTTGRCEHRPPPPGSGPMRCE